MANSTCAMMIEWGLPKDGREMRALEEFATHVGWWNQLKSSGKIAEFRVRLGISFKYDKAG